MGCGASGVKVKTSEDLKKEEAAVEAHATTNKANVQAALAAGGFVDDVKEGESPDDESEEQVSCCTQGSL